MSAMDQTAVSAPGGQIVDLQPALLSDWLREGSAVLLDVREDFERASEWIPGSWHHALSQLDPKAVRRICDGKRIVFHCRSGKRSHEAAAQFRDAGELVFHLAGGIEAWKAAGMPVERATGGGIDVMRQVQITAGGLVLVGVLLGALVSPWFLLLSGFVGGGLMFAGLSGWCGMAKLLARMPWNRTGASCSMPRAQKFTQGEQA